MLSGKQARRDNERGTQLAVTVPTLSANTTRTAAYALCTADHPRYSVWTQYRLMCVIRPVLHCTPSATCTCPPLRPGLRQAASGSFALPLLPRPRLCGYCWRHGPAWGWQGPGRSSALPMHILTADTALRLPLLKRTGSSCCTRATIGWTTS